MQCPHLLKWLVSSCKAVERPYIPSLFEMEEYCRTGDHRKCPFYMRDIIMANTVGAFYGGDAIAEKKYSGSR